MYEQVSMLFSGIMRVLGRASHSARSGKSMAATVSTDDVSVVRSNFVEMEYRNEGPYGQQKRIPIPTDQ